VDAVIKPDFQSKKRHFIFTDEHDQLRDSIRSFVVRELQPHAEEWEETTFPNWVFTRMGELGFLGLSYPEEYGGQGGDYYANIVLSEEMAQSHSGGTAMGIAVHTDMATPPIHLFGTEEQKQRYLVPSIKGEKISCLGITEPDAGSDVSGIKTRAVRDGDDYVINGSKTYITNGTRADYIVLVTKTDVDAGYDGFTLFIVDTDTPGFIVENKLKKLGMHASDTALLAFNDMRVPADAVLGQVGGEAGREAALEVVQGWHDHQLGHEAVSPSVQDGVAGMAAVVAMTTGATTLAAAPGAATTGAVPPGTWSGPCVNMVLFF